MASGIKDFMLIAHLFSATVIIDLAISAGGLNEATLSLIHIYGHDRGFPSERACVYFESYNMLSAM